MGDIRYALRIFRHEPAMSLSAVITLALAVGVTTAVFSVLYGVLLRPLPFPDAGRLVRVWEEHPGGTPIVRERLNALTYDAWKDTPRTLDALATFGSREFTVTGPSEPERVMGAELSPSMFDMLGVHPAAGRFFRDEDAATGHTPVVVLSHRFWQQRFGARGDAIGKVLQLDGRPHEVIGVAPAWFYFPDREARIWRPYGDPRAADPDTRRTHVMRILGRLRPGANIADVEAEGTAAARSVPRPMSAELMFGKGEPQVRARRLVDSLVHEVRPAVLVVTAAVGLVLLLACANIANLLLARGISRTREIAVRAALGASRPRLLRHVLVESLLLSAIGGALGTGLAALLIQALPAWAPADFPRLDDVRLDLQVLVFTLAVTVAAGVLAGILPALRASGTRPQEALRAEGGRTATGGGERVRALLLGTEAAIGVVLLIGAGLLGRSFVALATVDAGYRPENLLAARIHLPPAPDRPNAARLFIDTLMERLAPMPGVVSAGAGNMAPFGDSSYMVGFQVPPSAGMARALYLIVTPSYGEALGLKLREGRFLAQTDVSSGSLAVVINEAFVRAYLNDGKPVVGRQFRGLLGSDDTLTEIVGVVGDVLLEGLDAKAQPQMYVALGNTRTITREIYLFVRSEGAPSDLLPTVRSVVREIDPGAVLADAGPFAAEVSQSIAQPRFAAAVLGVIAGLALVLAATGLYAAVSYGVSRRRRELGIRAALGARPRDAVRLVLAHGLGVTAAGVIAGLFIAGFASRAVRPLLFGVSNLDPLSFVVTPILLLAVAALGCAIPARRAAAVDPAETLRSE
jgi:putative ABC transport system permease protein